MHDVKDISYYKGKAKQLTKKRFDELVTKARVRSEDYWVQLLAVASILQQQDRTRLESQAENLTFVPPKDVNQYLFNDLNFILWAMPQDNPIPLPIYEKMMKLKRLHAEGLPITPRDELTGEEKIKLVDSITWKRGDDKFGVEIIGSTRSGIAFGQDRLLLIWAITEAIKAGEPTVIGFIVKDFFDYFGIHAKGRVYEEVEERCQRLQETTIRVWWTTDKGKFELQCNYLDTVAIFRPKKGKHQDKGAMNMITLHLSLWAHLAKENYVWLHPEVIKALKESPGALDLYQWACAYAFKNKVKDIPIPEFFIHSGMKEEQPYKNKRTSLKRCIEKVNEVVNKETISGIGTHFRLILQENKHLRKPDNLRLQPQSNQK